MNKKQLIYIFSVVLFPALIGDMAHARDLASAATTGADTIKNVSQILAVTGVVGGGAIMQLPGAGDFGKRVMVSGIVGCLCAFGAPAFMSLMKTVFGS